MALYRDLRTNFAAGQLSPELIVREDLAMWQKGVTTATNNEPVVEGGLNRRRGSLLKSTLSRDEDAQAFLFRFSSTQRYLVMIEDGGWYIHNVDTGALIDSSTSDIPWDSTNFKELDVAQEGDYMMLVHPDVGIYQLTRTGASTFTLAEFDFEENTEQTNYTQPYFRYADGNIYMTPVVGTYTYLEGASALSTGWTLGETVTGGTSGATATLAASDGQGGIVVSSITGTFSAGETVTGGTSGETTVLSNPKVENDVIQWTASSAAFDFSGQTDLLEIWRWSYTLENAALDDLEFRWYEGQVVGVTSTTVAYATVRSELPTWGDLKGAAGTNAEFIRRQYEQMPWWTGTPLDSDYIPTDIWEEPAFSPRRGYPKSVCFHNQRLIFAGHKTLKAYFWISRPGAPFNFDTLEGLDNGSIQAGLGTGVGIEVNWVRSSTHIHFIAKEGTWYLPESPARPLTPSNANARQTSDHGGGDQCRPVTFDDALIYVQLNNKTLRELRLVNETSNPYQTTAINLVARGIVTDAIQMSHMDADSDGAEQFLFVVNSDGTMALYHGNVEQQINAWFPWTTDGEWKQVVAIEDDVFCYSKRSINSVDTMMWEKFDQNYSLDCVIEASNGTPTDTFTGFGDFNDEAMHIVDANGKWYYGTATPSGGSLTLGNSQEAEDIEVGFNYTRSLVTLPANLAVTGAGNLRARKKRVVTTFVNVQDAASLTVNGKNISLIDDEDLNTALPLFTGWFKAGGAGWDRDAIVTLSWDTPLKCLVRGIHWHVRF